MLFLVGRKPKRAHHAPFSLISIRRTCGDYLSLYRSSGSGRVRIPLDSFVVMVLYLGFVFEYLAVQFIDQRVDGRI
ncbi:MAG: hypothetical protein V7642_1057, partial [Burkholderiales bacterium]